MEQILEKLFESVLKVRLLRLFVRNVEEHFTLPEIVKKTQAIRGRQIRRELGKLLKLGVVKTKIEYFKEEIRKKSRLGGKTRKIIIKTKKARVFYTNPEFKLLDEMRALITRASVAPRGQLLPQIRGLGGVKLCVISGVFLNSENSRTDLLLVGDNIKKRRLDGFLAKIESEIGKSLRYTVMDTAEFKYRRDMYDRFLRDIMEYPHEKLVNKLHV